MTMETLYLMSVYNAQKEAFEAQTQAVAFPDFWTWALAYLKPREAR